MRLPSSAGERPLAKRRRPRQVIAGYGRHSHPATNRASLDRKIARHGPRAPLLSYPRDETQSHFDRRQTALEQHNTLF